MRTVELRSPTLTVTATESAVPELIDFLEICGLGRGEASILYQGRRFYWADRRFCRAGVKHPLGRMLDVVDREESAGIRPLHWER
jgi:hypothetical protein